MRCRIRELVELLAVVPLLAACASSPPIIRDIELDRRPSATVPLAVQLSFITDRPTSVVLEIDDGSGFWLVDPGSRPATEHIVPVLGLRPGTRYTVTVIVSDENGATDLAAPKSRANVIGDVLVEFTREGEIVREVKLLDVLDPYRVSYSSRGAGFGAPVYTESFEYPLRDWAHTNAVVSDATGRYALASERAQDAVVKVDLETGEPVWILGHPDGWAPEFEDRLLKPVGDLLWPYHQHASMFTPEGTILMFDNGNERAWPFLTRTPPSEAFSRAVEYRVDEDNMEVS